MRPITLDEYRLLDRVSMTEICELHARGFLVMVTLHDTTPTQSYVVVVGTLENAEGCFNVSYIGKTIRLADAQQFVCDTQEEAMEFAWKTLKEKIGTVMLFGSAEQPPTSPQPPTETEFTC